MTAKGFKPNKKKTGSKRTAGKKMMPTKKLAKKSAILKKKPAKKKSSQRRPVVKTKAAGKTTMAAKTVSGPKRRVREQSQPVDRAAFSPGRPRAGSGGQSGDLQGLSGVESVNSESVDELLEEGNAFEADIVTGVEEAGNTDEKEVHTREVPEDDVPGEYLDKD
jgi:hypothetical protein